GGAGVARGYLGRPELTAEKFVPDVFGYEPGARAYRTGDRVRWRADGELEFLGRIDQQVKIRGFRVEPGEVEAALLSDARVSEAVVTVREDVRGHRQLVAYVVGETVSTTGLRERLSRRLPEHMVPGAIVVLDRLPLNANGKVDRRVLPAPEQGTGAEYVAPRTAAEEVLSGIWAEVLGAERVGIEENFFELGGHSLLATQVVSRVRQAFGVELPLRALFEAPTVAGLAGRVEALRGGGLAAPPIERSRDARTEPPPLSFAQQRLWLVDRIEPGSAAYNMPFPLRLRGVLDPAALRASLDALVARHEALRTTFMESGGMPAQVVHPPAPVALVEQDLRDEPDAEAEAERRVVEEAVRPFDLARGPLLRATLLRLTDDDHVLMFTMHHVVSDGWSTRVLVREVSTFYAAYSRGEEPRLPELPVQYADFALWQRRWLSGETLQAQIDYWKRQLSGAPPLLEIPVDHPRSTGQSPRAQTFGFRISPEVSDRLRGLSRREGTTLFMTLLAGWQALLARYAGQEELVVGTPIAGRNRTELEGLIGFFVNMLPLRGDLSEDPSWAELLGRVREATLGAYEHQDLPFERLVEELAVERSLTHSPVFQVIFTLDQAGRDGHELELGGLALEPFGRGEKIAKFDLDLVFTEGGEALDAALVYRAALFDVGTIERMAGHLQALLETMAAEPGQRVSALSLLRGAERDQVLQAWNATVAEYRQALVHEQFAEQAARTPHAPAVQSGEEVLRYAELDARSNRLAHHLRSLGVGPDTRVGVCLRRTPELIVALLGVLKAGGAYVPLDPAYPAERIAYLLEDAAVPVLLTEAALLARLPTSAAETVCVDRDAPRITACPREAPAAGVSPENLAYVIYTSGSTGRPKGVGVEHRNVAALLGWLSGQIGSEERSAVLASTSMSFDVSVAECFDTLCGGGTLVLVENALELASIPAGTEVRLACMVPTAAAELLRSGRIPASLRTLNLAGEALPDALAQGLLEAGVERVVNLYGPTEVTVYSTFREVERGAPSVTIGRPLANLHAYVLDERLNPVPVGVPGELCIGGKQVARGYLGRPALTAERFVPDPFSGEAGARMYRTGDRVRWTAMGELEYLGRLDQQVKVRGFRIELREIEATLLELPQVCDAVALLREDTPGEKRLVAYVVPQHGGRASAAELREELGARLPDYMVPSVFVALEHLPVTANGKVDRRALPAPQVGVETTYVAPRTEIEELLCTIWLEVLRPGGEARPGLLGIEENFFELGGHSLLATRVVSRVREVFGVEVPLRALFETPTVAGLAGRIEALRRAGAGAAPPVERVPREGRGGLPLSFAQHRLWLVDRLDPHSVAYNLPGALRLRGVLDVGVLRASLNALVARHETLRTVFAERGGEPIQVIHPPAPVALAELDLRGLQEARRVEEAWRLASEEALRPFDLERGPLLRSTLLRLADDDHVLLYTLHHVVSDGWSTQVLVGEVSALYGAYSRGEEPRLPELPVQYADFAVWQR
ncbi:MAG: amino acid adenylation domain-containing protein, partial [Gemmatimonadetes bacterium]|nr:amino acid adenylation domain-containing protein [Gemmatimonadota bacterium]